jgi:hypothetical protein
MKLGGYKEGDLMHVCLITRMIPKRFSQNHNLAQRPLQSYTKDTFARTFAQQLFVQPCTGITLVINQ